MGNICAVDMGIIVMRISVFDRYNQLFPYKIQKKLNLRGSNENLADIIDKNYSSAHEPYFLSDLSFYSKEHGGTFHFLQFNVIYREQFLNSEEFKHFLRFIEKTYPQFKRKENIEQWGEFVENLEFKKSFIDYEADSEFCQSYITKNMNHMPILSTGGYNDKFLKFLANCFNTKIVKCREYMRFVITAIDYLNKWTNDCFFTLDRQSENTINFVGKLKQGHPPQQQFFSLKRDLYPYLLVNVRSGATFTRVDSKTEHKRITGSVIGSNLFMGVLRIINRFSDPKEALNGAVEGDSTDVDMSVGDIYGGEYKGLNLPQNMIASSFGKLQKVDDPLGPNSNIKGNDIAKSLLTMVSVNTLIMSKMIAQIEKIKSVVWIGAHVDVLEYMQMSQDAFKVVNNQECKLIFPTYHSFLGSLGLLLSQETLESSGLRNTSEEESQSEQQSQVSESEQKEYDGGPGVNRKLTIDDVPPMHFFGNQIEPKNSLKDQLLADMVDEEETNFEIIEPDYFDSVKSRQSGQYSPLGSSKRILRQISSHSVAKEHEKLDIEQIIASKRMTQMGTSPSK